MFILSIPVNSALLTQVPPRALMSQIKYPYDLTYDIIDHDSHLNIVCKFVREPCFRIERVRLIGI